MPYRNQNNSIEIVSVLYFSATRFPGHISFESNKF